MMFVVRPFEAKTISWWYNKKDDLDLNPPYQRRGEQWNTKKKAFLIDSIINEFDIPKIYIADFILFKSNLNKNKRAYAIIDGRQRIEAMFDFYRGNLSLNKDFYYYKEPTLKLGGMKYVQLKSKYPDIASTFENHNLQVMSVITDDEPMINELFVRLNSSKPLTGAQIRNAMSGIVPDLIRELSSHPFFKTRIRFSISQDQDKNAVAKLLLIEFKGSFVDTKRAQLDRMVDEVNDNLTDIFINSEATENNIKLAAQQVSNVLDMMTDIFLHKDTLLNTQGQLSVYYWFIKKYGATHKKQIRRFLVLFNLRLKENIRKRKDKISESHLDKELLLYEAYNRNINDQQSLRGRFEILKKRFENSSSY